MYACYSFRCNLARFHVLCT